MSTFVRPKWAGFGRAALIGAIVALFGAPTGVSAQDLADKYEQMRNRPVQRAQFSLHAEPVVQLDANQFQCGLRNNGDTCADAFDSPTGGGGFWPTGSPNQYMFNSGIMIAGIIPADAGFEWAGDTTGAYFMDARGTQQHGTPITNIYNSLDPEDLANWPTAGSIPGFPEASAVITDEDIFSDILIGRKAGSQQDSWVMYWDGDPGLSANRDHPMGVTIEQRTMAWNFPSGNEATIFIFYKITNVTNNPTFLSLNETRFGLDLPDGGWPIGDIYLAYDADPDVTTDATENFASVILPFNMGITYHAQFVAPEFSYPPSLFFPPFFTQAPGIVGVQYLKSPVNPETGEEVGLTMFSVHENPGSCTGLCDPLGVKQLWRYISGNVSPGLGDPPCSFENPQESRICYLPQQPADARFFQASGPFELDPGQSTTIVVAMMAGATVDTDQITLGDDNPPGIPSLRPGCGDEEILPIEIGAGWEATPAELCTATPEGTTVDLRQVITVPSSLLGKAQVAQAVFDGKFLLPFAPEPPPFFLVAGDEQVAVVWERSASEEPVIDETTGDTIGGGDPFFDIASQETLENGDPNPLFNPNYRQFDVEGYRIYRSTDNANFDLIAQFDYSGTEFVDVRCEADRTFVPGPDDEADCTEEHIGINDVTDINDDFIVDPFVLFGGAGAQRLRLEDGRTLAIAGDSASPGTTPDLADTGVPFVFIDEDVRNGFRYFYQVRAFDINSTFSGPISLESSSDTKNTIPRASTIDPATAQFTVALLGADGQPLETGVPDIDPVTGTFASIPATTAISVDFLPFAPDLLALGSFEVSVDSVALNYYGGTLFLTSPEGNTLTATVPDPSATGSVQHTVLGPFSIPADSALAAEQAAGGGDPPPNAGAFSVDIAMQRPQWNSGDADWAPLVPAFWVSSGRLPAGAVDGGSRFFTGANETMADPTLGLAHGEIPGVTIFQPVPYNGVLGSVTNPVNGAEVGGDLFRRFYQTTWAARRQADVEIRWGAGGTVTEVVDVTHNIPVPFKGHTAANYGFVADNDGNGVLSFGDFYYLNGLEPAGTWGNIPASANGEDMVNQPVVMATDVTGDHVSESATGFAMYIAGHPFLFTGTGADGDVWTLRMYNGAVVKGGSGYTFTPTVPNPMLPGLRIAVTVTAPASFVPGTVDLTQVHTVPDPYYAQSAYDLSPVEKALRFVNLPPAATIRIYTVSGLLVDVLNHNDPAGGGLTTWDLKNRSGQFVASGVYFYHVSTPDGQEHIGRFTVINSGIGQ